MRDRSFIAAIALVGALALLILIGNIRDATAPLYGPPNVDEEDVMSKVGSGQLSFEEARFYSPGDDRSTSSRPDVEEDRPRAGDSQPGTGTGPSSGGSGAGERDK